MGWVAEVERGGMVKIGLEIKKKIRSLNASDAVSAQKGVRYGSVLYFVS